MIENDDSDVAVAAMGPGIRSALVRFMTSGWSAYGCEHRDRPQVASAGDAESLCFGCAIGTARMDEWRRGGVCDVCNAHAPGVDRVWLVPVREGFVVALRLCPVCALTELHDPEPNQETNMSNNHPPCADCDAAWMESAATSSVLPSTIHAECASRMRTLITAASKLENPDRQTRIDTLRLRAALVWGAR